jgi:hypothetical protein
MFSLQDFAIAFEKWEKDYRVNPTTYLTTEEIANCDLSELSVDRAEYFMELLTEDKE